MCDRIIKSSRKCFKSILTIAVSGNSLLSTAQYLIGIQRHENVPIQPLLPITFNANASCISLTFYPSDSLTKLAHNRLPISVSWKTLSYDCTKDNGRKITLKDIGEGDIIILIDELDKTSDE